MSDPIEDDARREVDAAGDFDQGVDRAGPAQQRRIIGNRRPPGGDRALQPRHTVDGRHLADAGLGIRPHRRLRMAVRDRDQAHARNRVDDLIGDRPAHRPGPDHPDADRPAAPLAFLQRAIDDDHGRAPTGTGSSSGQAASFSEIVPTGSGRRIPSLGSL